MRIGLVLMLVGLSLMLISFAISFAAAVTPPPAAADEGGLRAVEAALKRLDGVGVRLLLLCFSCFSLFILISRL
ncbi:MAG: hypothetical protein QXE92_00295 [Thermofilaceae archaeon]